MKNGQSTFKGTHDLQLCLHRLLVFVLHNQRGIIKNAMALARLNYWPLSLSPSLSAAGPERNIILPHKKILLNDQTLGQYSVKMFRNISLPVDNVCQ